MASNIVPDTIDDAYPVAGQDNDSQGFRDNFNIIKTNFTYSKSEIEDLQDNTAKTNEGNVFFENTNSRYVSKQESIKFADVGERVADYDVDLTLGHHFAITNDATRTLTFTGWSDHGTDVTEYQEMIVHLKGNGVSPHVISLAGKKASGLSSDNYYVQDSAAFGGAAQVTMSTNTSDVHVVKAYTYDQGATIFFEYVGKFITAS